MPFQIGPAARIVAIIAVFASADRAKADFIVVNGPDPLLTGLAIPANAATMGMWSPVQPWPLIGLHSALMPSGVVMTYGSPLGRGVQDGRTFDIWDPAKGFAKGSHFTLANAQQVDSFCSAATFLSTGAMLLSGGNSNDSGYSAKASSLFDPATQTATAAVSQLAFARWYGTIITVPNGQALALGGGKPYVVEAYRNPDQAVRDGAVSMTPEIYSPDTGWKAMPTATSRTAFGPDDNRWWYPRAWVTPSGAVFGLSANKMWQLTGNGTLTDLGDFKTPPGSATLRPNVGATSTAVMYDTAKILQVGGNGVANGQPTVSSNAATIFAINGSRPVWKDTAPMTHPRQWASSIVTADGKVVVTGGTRFGDNAGKDAVYPAEIWNPKTGRWTIAASAAVYRGYHSTTLLLPNGAILSTGGGVPGPVNNFNAEIFYPPYLFKAENGRSVLASRPVIRSLNSNKQSYGTKMTVRLANNETIAKVVMLGAGSGTHSFNSSQRLVPVTFSNANGVLTVNTPANANLAPPGYYLVHVVNGAGVPSRGVMVSLGAAFKAPVVQPAQPSLPVDGKAYSFEPSNFPGYRIRHYDYIARIDPIGTGSPAIAKLDSSFLIRKGLADPTCYSLESRNLPGSFLRVVGDALLLRARETGSAYSGDATFCARPGFSGLYYALESYSNPGRFLRHRNYQMRLDLFDGTEVFKADGTFKLVPALL